MKNEKYNKISQKLQSGVFGFRVKQRRFTFIVVFLIIFLGIFSLTSIPKESTPEIEFGIISISTIYPGATSTDVDNLITEKIEKQIKDTNGINKMSSTSNNGFSSIIIELKNDANTKDVMQEIKDQVDNISLPTDVDDPIIKDISFNNEMMFSVLLYGDESKFSEFYIKERGRKLKASLEGKGKINRIDFDSSMGRSLGDISNAGDGFYDIKIFLDKEKADELGIGAIQISQIIKNRNSNQPLGTYTLGDKGYSFRIQGELKNINELGELPIQTRNGSIKLKNISSIQKTLKSDNPQKLGGYSFSGQNYVSLFFNKQKGDNIFTAAKQAKKDLEKEFQKTEYDGLSYIITLDLAEMINEDYNSLAKNGIQTFILVFLALLVFIGFKESLIATITLPLAFFITFIVLKNLGLSLNFLTNFSFIITFGIAIDTTIVVIEGAHEKMRQGFKPMNAILLAVKEYKTPLIAGTATTIVVFIPLLTLPGIMGKFLAYIPITIFSTLVSALIISLTVNSALYYKLSKNNKYFNSKVGDIDYLSDEDKVILQEDRKGKTEISDDEKNKREQILDKLSIWYSEKLGDIIQNPKKRILSIIFPIAALIGSFIFISPFLGFELFPANDNGYLTANIKGSENTSPDSMLKYKTEIEKVLSKQKEIKVYYANIIGNTIDINIELFPEKYRKQKKLKSSLDMESGLKKDFSFLESNGLLVSVSAQSDGPPSSKPIGIKFFAESCENLGCLDIVSEDFKKFLSQEPGVINLESSSKNSPGEFVYSFDQTKMSLLGLDPNNIFFDVFSKLNGISAGSIKGTYDDHDIKIIYYDKNEITPQTINNININTSAGKINLGNITNYSFEKGISSINRENNKIFVSISADVEKGYKSDTIQNNLESFAKKYNFPSGVSYSMGGESAENMDLIQAIIVAFAIAILSIFAILVLQFNSYIQPVIILYSVIVGLLGANIGLRITGQSYGLMFGIGFIALTGIIVNDAIVLLDRTNNNIKKGMDKLSAIKEAGKARLQPIILTTITTFLGLMSIVGDPMRKPLAITIMVGIVSGSVVTLFVIPNIYFDKEKLKHIVRRTILKYGIYLFVPILLSIGVYIVLTIIGINKEGLFGQLLLAIFVGFNIWYGFYTIHALSQDGQTIIQKFLGTKILSTNGGIMTEKQATKRFFVSLATLIGPIVVAGIISGIVGIISSSIGSALGIIIGITGYLYILTKNLVSIRTSENNTSWTDKICNTITIDEKIIKD